MTSQINNYKKYIQEYIPKSFTCFKEGYTRAIATHDIFAGISVGIIALPLALAFAIGSGVTPDKGLFTAIIAGFLISFLGGSRVQIGGPTGAYIPIVYSIVQRHGYEGLAIATLLAGILMILMGIARFGVLLKFIPYPVTTGFTTGIAVVIFSSQIKDFFGLGMENHPEFIEKCKLFCAYAHTWNPWAVLIACFTLFLIIFFRKLSPLIPGAILAIIAATCLAYAYDLPLETIESKFGSLPSALPWPALPSLSYVRIQEMFPDAISIALLGAIESLLSAVIADGVTGHRHRSNGELVAQGAANIGSVLFGGIPATGAIARTSANIRLGAKTPLAGMVHALTLLILMLFLSPLAIKIPLASLAALLIYVAWNMSELESFLSILKGQPSDALVLMITFLLTVLIDLAVAVQIGVILAAFLFIKRMSETAVVKACELVVSENEQLDISDDKILQRQDIPEDVRIFEITGPFFYSVAGQLDDVLNHLDRLPRVFILSMRHVSLIDSSGMKALKEFAERCNKQKILLIVSGIKNELLKNMEHFEVTKSIPLNHFFPTIDSSLRAAQSQQLRIDAK